MSLEYIAPTWDTNFKVDSYLHKFKLIVYEGINHELFHIALWTEHNGDCLITVRKHLLSPTWWYLGKSKYLSQRVLTRPSLNEAR